MGLFEFLIFLEIIALSPTLCIKCKASELQLLSSSDEYKMAQWPAFLEFSSKVYQIYHIL